MQPKTNQKLLARFSAGLFLLAIFFYGYQWIRNRAADIDVGTVDTRGWIAAIEYLPGGAQAVAIKPDGTVLKSSGYVTNKGWADRDVVWRPDGNRIYFASNRVDPQQPNVQAYNLYRWNPGKDLVERRTMGKISKLDPSFASGIPSEDNLNPLMVYGGKAWELDASRGEATQVFPVKPTSEKNAPQDLRDPNAIEGQGSGFGTGDVKVRLARYFAGKTWVAVIRKTEEGDRLEVQKVGSNKREDHLTLAAGDHINIDVDPKNGRLFFEVLGFQWPDVNDIPPQFMQNGVAKKPFRHYIWFFDASVGHLNEQPVVASQDDKTCFSQLSVSPEGTMIAVTAGPYKGNGDYETRTIHLFPAKAGAAREGYQVFPASGSANFMISGLTWNPTGHQVAFIESGQGEKVIATVDDDGRNFKELTKGQGNFGFPKFSPQLQAPG